MAYVKRGKPAGRPKTYHSDAEKPRHLSVRIPAVLYARLEAAAAEQQSVITRVTTQALEAFLGAQAPLDLAAIVAKREAALDRATDALVNIQGACDPCARCTKEVDRILTEAWTTLSSPGHSGGGSTCHNRKTS
jgi:hypothetical protein